MRPCLLLSLLVAVRLSAQPYLVKDITTTPVLVSSFPSFLAAKGGTTYFEATTDGGRFTLWKSDGTPGGTTPVTWREIRRGSDTAFAGDKLIFNAFEGDRFHLFATDGTEAGTVKLKTFSKSSSPNVDAWHLISAGTLVYFIGLTSPEGRELWRTDGTPEGTRIVADLIPGNTPGPGASHPRHDRINSDFLGAGGDRPAALPH